MRDLAGLIVIDFIDMESRKNNIAVERRLKESLKNDRARIQMGTISHFGLMEMSRQRLRPSLAEASLVLCPHCQGMGQLRSPESAALHILRAIEDEGAKFRAAEIAVVLPPEIAFYLFNHKRERLSAIEARYAMRVLFQPDASMTGTSFRIDKIKTQVAAPPVAAPASYTGAGPVAPERKAEPVSAPVEEPEAEEESEDEAAEAPNTADTSEEGDRKRKRRRRRGKRRPEGASESAPPAAPGVPGEGPEIVQVVEEDAPSEFDLVLAAELGEPEEVVAPVVEEPVRRRRAGWAGGEANRDRGGCAGGGEEGGLVEKIG